MNSGNPRRRRIEPASESTEGRSGCLVVGAVLGVIVGVALGLFALPSVLNMLFAGEPVAVGETYNGDGREITVVAVYQGNDAVQTATGARRPGTVIELDVVSRKTWELEPAFFQLELTTGGSWRTANDPVAAIPETSLEFALGERRRLVLQFDAGPGDGLPRRLHLSDPNISMDLPPPQP